MMAPFDQEVNSTHTILYAFEIVILLQFYFIINLTVGGTHGYFPDFKNTQSTKPLIDTLPSAMKDFWTNRNQWLPTWNSYKDDICLIVDSVRVWAI